MKKKVGIFVIVIIMSLMTLGISGACSDKETHFSVSFLRNVPPNAHADVQNLPDGIAKVEKGSLILAPQKTPSLQNYRFGGWYKESECVNPWDFAVDTVEKKTLLYAKWTHESKFRCDIVFEANLSIVGDDIISSYLVGNMPAKIEGAEIGGSVNAPASGNPFLYLKGDTSKTPVTDVATFHGWFMSPECNDADEFVFGTTIVEKETMLYAKWVKAEKYVPSKSILFDANKPGSVLTEVQGMPESMKDIVENGTAAAPVSEPTLDGYIFGGWYTDKDCAEEYVWSFDTPVVEDMILYAKWTEAPPPVRYEVSFDGNLSLANYAVGNLSAPVEVVAGGTVSAVGAPFIYLASDETETPVLDVAVFAGWFTDAGFSEPFTFGVTPVTSKTTLYAKWTVTVKLNANLPFEANGGDLAGDFGDIAVTLGAEAADPGDPSLVGYTFEGWYKDAACTDGQEWTFDTALDGNIELFAKWTPDSPPV